MREERRLLVWPALAVVAAALAAVPGSPAAAAFDCRTNLDMNVAAHEDDDLYFMNPDVQRDVAAGRCTLTVFATAGDAGRDADYWQGRESGARAAYAHMAGMADVWTSATVTIAGHELTVDTLVGRPSVGLLFMRLPDGDGGNGFPAYGNESLQKLWENTITTITAVDDSASYSRSALIATYTGIMNAYRPTLIRTQDYVDRFGDGDHSDHHASAYFALTAHRSYVLPHTITAYEAYAIASLPANLTTAQRDEKVDTFLAYAPHDPQVCQTRDACLDGSTGARFSRRYTVGSELGGRQNAAPTGTVTASSQNTTTGQQAAKVVDGVVAGNPQDPTREWATVGGKAGSWVTIAWRSPHTVDKVVLYDRPNRSDQVTGGSLRFSDGSTVATGSLPNDGSAKVVTVAPRRVTSVRFTVTAVSASTRNVGLAELQAFTTNVAPRASVTASSQNTSTGQQASKAVDGYALGNPEAPTREWATVGGRAGSWLRLTWPVPVTVSRVVLYDRPNGYDQITGGTLTFSDGSTMSVGSLPNNGAGRTLTFPARTITSLRLTVTSVSATTRNVGLAELQVER